RRGALALEAAADRLVSRSGPRRACISDRCRPLGQDRLRLTREGLNRSVELPRQACRRCLARRLHHVRELLRRRVRVARGGPGKDALQLLELSTLDVRKAGLDAPYGFRLLPFDQLGELALPPANSLVELVEGASAFGGVGLELGASRRDGLLRRERGIIPQTYEPCALPP